MAKNIFIASTEPGSGKSLITLGLFNALAGIVPNVGYMKPIGQKNKKNNAIDNDVKLIKKIFNLTDNEKDLNPISLYDNNKNKDAVFEKVFESYSKIEKDKDIVILEGTDYTSTISALEFDINAELAQNINAPVLLIANGSNKSINEIIQTITTCTDSFREGGCNFLGVIINRIPSTFTEKDMIALSKALSKEDISLFGTIKNDRTLSGPRLKEVVEKINADIVFQGDDLSKVVTGVKVLAMTPENALNHIHDQDGYLLITPGDRVEHIFTLFAAQKSTAYPKAAGIILSGGLTPGNNMKALIKGIHDTDLTLLSVKEDTYNTAIKVNQITGELNEDDTEKISLAFHMVERYVNVQKLHTQLGLFSSNIMTPRMFQFQILEKAKSLQKHIVLPEGNEVRIIKAAQEIANRKICKITLLGHIDEIETICRQNDIKLENVNILDITKDKKQLNDFSKTYYELRKHKGITKNMAQDTMLGQVHYATMMVHKGLADGFVSGAVHSTSNTLRPVLQIIKCKDDVSLASSIFFMCLPEKILIYGDCALVENPTAEEMANIAINSAETAKSFGISPYIAMLSYSTGESGKGADVDKVREATTIVKKKRPDLPIEGPIQYDAANSEKIAKIKMKDSAVAGKANIYIFPSLSSGNTAYKAVQQSAKITAIGPIMQGLNKPANDLSRGATVKDIFYTIAITAIQAE